MPNRQSLLLPVFVSVSIFTALNLTLAHAAPLMIVGICVPVIRAQPA